MSTSEVSLNSTATWWCFTSWFFSTQRVGLVILSTTFTRLEVGGALQHDGPGCEPRPELDLLVGIELEVVRLLRVALEKPREGLARIHDA